MKLRSADAPSYDDLAARLADAEAALDAVAADAVDSLVSGLGAGAEIIGLERADSFFVTLVTEMQEATASLDSGGTLLYANPRFAELLGLPLSRMLGRTLAELTAKAGRAAAQQLLAEAARGPVRGTLDLLHEDGRLVPVSVSAAPIAGERPEVCFVATDLTERIEAEAAAERLKSEFFAQVSHELRTPVTAISGFVDLLVQDESERLSEAGRGTIEIVKRNADRLDRLVDDLLLVAQVEAGTFGIEWGEIRVADLVHDLEQESTAGAVRSGVNLSFTVEDIPPFAADPHRISQVIENLVSNAVKFTPDRGRVSVSIRAAGDACVIEVSDTGAGIEKAELERLFDRFYRSRSAGNDQVRGVGLGLAIVKALVESHGGRIEVESEPGVGSTFRVHLPMRPA